MKYLFLLFVVLLYSNVASAAENLYCGSQDCYSVLGIEKGSTAKQIKKAYYKLSVKYHPDKNKAEDATQKFQEIANAYEILRDAETRANYDDMLENPQDYYTHQYRYYKYRSKQINPWWIFWGCVAIASTCHFMYWHNRHHKMMYYAMRTTRCQTRKRAQVKTLTARYESEVKAEKPGKGKLTVEEKMEVMKRAEEEAEAIVRQSIQISGWQGRPPTMEDILVFRLIELPWKVYCKIFRSLRWQYRYSLKGMEYTPEDSIIMTYTTMKISKAKWAIMEQERKDDYVSRKLWVKENMKNFETEMRREYVQQRGSRRGRRR